MMSKMFTILMIDDEVRLLETYGRRLRNAGYEVATAPMPLTALEVLKAQRFDLIICDLRMPGMTGLELQNRARELHPEIPFVLATAYGDDETVAELFRNGGVEYLKKPFGFADLLSVVQKVEETENIKRENAALREENLELKKTAAAAAAQATVEIVAQSERMQDVMRRLTKVARSEASVLLRGESGTGKEVMARFVHANSPRAERIFLSTNCGAIAESLLEAELFGHRKGSFTGATEDRKGLFETANGGTLFLDEIGEVPLHLQVKLLRALQEGEIQRVGDPIPQRVNVRVIAATNRDLEAEVAAGRFRQDLFYRLNIIPIVLPPLRERNGDVDNLIEFFLRKYAADSGATCTVTSQAMQLLRHYNYPGNIRELENAIHHAAVLCDNGEIHPEDLPEQMRLPLVAEAHEPTAQPVAVVERISLDELEAAAILDALRRSHFNRTKTAERLNITRRTLGYRIEKHDLEPQIEKMKNELENE